jgi:hypothetical protein
MIMIFLFLQVEDIFDKQLVAILFARTNLVTARIAAFTFLFAEHIIAVAVAHAVIVQLLLHVSQQIRLVLLGLIRLACCQRLSFLAMVIGSCASFATSGRMFHNGLRLPDELF